MASTSTMGGSIRSRSTSPPRIELNPSAKRIEEPAEIGGQEVEEAPAPLADGDLPSRDEIA